MIAEGEAKNPGKCRLFRRFRRSKRCFAAVWHFNNGIRAVFPRFEGRNGQKNLKNTERRDFFTRGAQAETTIRPKSLLAEDLFEYAAACAPRENPVTACPDIAGKCRLQNTDGRNNSTLADKTPSKQNCTQTKGRSDEAAALVENILRTRRGLV